mmetsp:Transcript_317/g.984  ORF Transcript_317/g.984 Transcript_317/m.984 type:complete len:349 (-) Transcript_317:130-1176(-)
MTTQEVHRRMSRGVGKPSTFSEAAARKADVIKAAADKAPPQVKGFVDVAALPLGYLGATVDVLAPFAVLAVQTGLAFWKALEPYHPEELLCVLVGVFMCFFGGEFPAVITAVEAYRQIGFEPTLKALKVLWADFQKVQEKFKEDGKVDADKDGVSDVSQMNAQDLVERKALLFLKTTDPAVTGEAMTAISAGYIAVLASLKITFAQAIVVGGAIGDVLRPPAIRHLKPLLKKTLNEDYHKWIEPGITYVCKTIAISLAWTLQRIISAFHSAVRGGQIAARGVVHYLHKYGFVSTDHDETTLDEIAGYALAFLGLAAQITFSARLPFPLSLVLVPFRLSEWGLRWSLSL